MMTDAEQNYRNSPRPGGPQWAPAAHARWRNHLAAHFSRAPTSQLPAFLLGPTRLADRHVDATDLNELVRLPDHELEIFARPGGCRGFGADGAFVIVGRRAR